MGVECFVQWLLGKPICWFPQFCLVVASFSGDESAQQAYNHWVSLPPQMIYLWSGLWWFWQRGPPYRPTSVQHNKNLTRYVGRWDDLILKRTIRTSLFEIYTSLSFEKCYEWHHCCIKFANSRNFFNSIRSTALTFPFIFHSLLYQASRPYIRPNKSLCKKIAKKQASDLMQRLT